MGAINNDGITFLDDLGRCITQVTDDNREKAFLYQRLSVLIQRLNRRDANETFSFETETRPRRSFLASRLDQDRDLPLRDRDVFRDVTNGTLC